MDNSEEFTAYVRYGSHSACSKLAHTLNRPTKRKQLGYSHCDIEIAEDGRVHSRLSQCYSIDGCKTIITVKGSTHKEMSEDGVYKMTVYFFKRKNNATK